MQEIQPTSPTILRQHVSTPPSDLQEGDRFLVDKPGLDEFASYDHHIATYTGDPFEFRLPEIGEILVVTEKSGAKDPEVLVYLPDHGVGAYQPLVPLSTAPQAVTTDGGSGGIGADQLDPRHTLIKLSPSKPWEGVILPPATDVPERRVTVLNLSADQFGMVGIAASGRIQGRRSIGIRPLGSLSLLAVGGGIHGTDWAIVGGTVADQVLGDGPVLRFTNLGSKGGFWEAAMQRSDGSFRFFSMVDSTPLTPVRFGARAADNLLQVGYSEPSTVAVRGTLRVNGTDVLGLLTELSDRLQALEG